MELNKIYNLDYKILTKKLLKNNIEVDLVLTDPPYNVSRKHQLGFSNMGRKGMDYGEWDYNFNQVNWIKDVGKLIKKGGSFIIFNDWKNMNLIAEELKKNNFEVKDLIRLVKRNPMPRNVNRRYVSDTEYAIWAVKKGEKWTFNKDDNIPYLRPQYIGSVVPGGDKRIHPTQKKLESAMQIICTHSNKGDLIYDPFSGSGTFSLAALAMERNFVACEIDENYYIKSLERIKYGK